MRQGKQVEEGREWGIHVGPLLAVQSHKNKVEGPGTVWILIWRKPTSSPPRKGAELKEIPS